MSELIKRSYYIKKSQQEYFNQQSFGFSPSDFIREAIDEKIHRTEMIQIQE